MLSPPWMIVSARLKPRGSVGPTRAVARPERKSLSLRRLYGQSANSFLVSGALLISKLAHRWPERLRILEIGEFGLFKNAYPDETTWIWTGDRSAPALADATATPAAMFRVLRQISDKSYDLIVATPPLYSPAHPRYWARAFFRRPWTPWAALTKRFGTSYLRFADASAPLVILDFNDCPSIGAPTSALADKAKFIFKRELPTDRWRVLSGVGHKYLPTQRIRRSRKWGRRIGKFRPINLPLFFWRDEFAPTSFPDKSVDIFFSGAVDGNSTLRAEGRFELERLRSLGVTVDFPEHALSLRDYCARMSRAWLAWSPEGLGWHCYRHAEAGLCQTVPVMNQPTVLRATPLEEGIHGFYYTPEPGGLSRAITSALADKAKLKRVAEAARIHSLANFTVKACCDYILDATFSL